jgi:hypothetical protein
LALFSSETCAPRAAVAVIDEAGFWRANPLLNHALVIYIPS